MKLIRIYLFMLFMGLSASFSFASGPLAAAPAPLAPAGFLPASAGPGDSTDFVAILKHSGPYDTAQRQTFPHFTYQSSSDPALTSLRLKYHLDSIAGNGKDIDKAIRLLEWFHDQVPHEDVAPLPVLTADNIIETYKTRHYAQGCYPLSVAMTEIFLSMGFKSRSVICFSNKYPVPNGGHVINTVFIRSFGKWIYMDPQDNAYIKDEKGNFLSIEEVRQRLIDGLPLVLNPTANYHHIPASKEDYLYTFMAQHIYRMISPLNSRFDSETRSQGKLLEYVELLPSGSADPLVDGYETSKRKIYSVICYHTNNNRLFWQNPDSSPE